MKKLSGPLPKKKLFLVNFPGNVVNVPNGIVLLGGIEKLGDSILNNREDNFEIRFRPNDLLSHGITGRAQPCSKMLCRFQLDENGRLLSGGVEGVVEQEVVFDELCDYQYVSATVENSLKLDNEQVLNIPPPRFSEEERTLFDYHFKENPYTKTEVVDGRTQKRFMSNSKAPLPPFIVKFADKEVPSSLPDVFKDPPAEDEEIFLFVKQLFEKRPSWRNMAIHELVAKKFGRVLGIKWRLKKSIPYVCYKFSDGPFRNCFFRFGVDPRDNSSFAKYQFIDFRVPRNLFSEMEKKKPEYSFVFASPPAQVVNYYQLIDVHLAGVRKIREEMQLNHTCDEKEGWFSKKTGEKIVNEMKNTLKKWFGEKKVDPSDIMVPPNESPQFYLGEPLETVESSVNVPVPPPLPPPVDLVLLDEDNDVIMQDKDDSPQQQQPQQQQQPIPPPVNYLEVTQNDTIPDVNVQSDLPPVIFENEPENGSKVLTLDDDGAMDLD